MIRWFKYLILLSGALFFVTTEDLFADPEQTITTYYPVKGGSYQTLRLYPHFNDSDPPGACAVGTLYVNYSDIPRYCANVSGTGTWGPIPDLWTQNGDYIYLTDTNPDLHVGIGTKTPEFKLSLVNDGGIIAGGSFGSGIILPDLGLLGASEFLWYPRKAAFRAGKVQSHEWSDSEIGNYSVALGDGPTAKGDYSVSAGSQNLATGNYAITLGGGLNSAGMDYAAVIGGYNNIAAGQYAIVTGGTLNQANADYCVVNGGSDNKANDSGFSVVGGDSNIVGGGRNNVISSLSSNINGGFSNLIQVVWPPEGYVTIGGGNSNSGAGSYTTIIGGSGNHTQKLSGSIGGGSGNSCGNPSSSQVQWGESVSGGAGNVAWEFFSTVSGGQNNSALGSSSTVAGGYHNLVSGNYSVIAGGSNNTANSQYSMVLGGESNTVSGDYSWAGGKNMNVTGSHTFAWGFSDTPVTINRSDVFVLVPGTISGLPSNPKMGIRTVMPSAVLEINGNASTDHYFNIKKSVTGDIFWIKNNGTVRIGRTVSDSNSHVLQIGMDGTNGNGAYLTVDGQWMSTSSRAKKDHIKPLSSQDAESALDMLDPVTFDYKVIPRQKNAGFIAEDVPDLVAMKGRDKLSALDITAVLTKVAQDQERMIRQQNERIQKSKKLIQELKDKLGE